ATVSAAATQGVAIGSGATVTNAGAVALGAGSTTAAAVGTPSATINGTAYTFAGTTPASTVSVGTVGAERTVTNVAAGRLSATSTDAVNGSQLYATDQAVDTLSTTVTANKTHYYSVNDGGTQGANYADDGATGVNALAAGVGALASGVSSTALGNGAQALANNATAFGLQATASIVGGVAIGSGSVSDRTVLPGVGSIANGTHAIPFNTSDETLLGAVSVGSSTAYRQLTNVADGTQAQDAVTVRQLAGALSSFSVTGTNYFHANSTAADSLAVGAQSIAVGPTTVVNGDNGVGVGNGAVVDATAPGGVAIGQQTHSAAADAMALGSGAVASGAQSIAQGANANAANQGGVAVGSGAQSSATDAVALGAGASSTFANSVALGSASTTAAAVATTGVAINGTAYTYAGTAPTSTVSVGSAGNERTVTNVAAGRVSATSTDAVNGSQLYATDQAVSSLSTTITANKTHYYSVNDGGTQSANYADDGATGTNALAAGVAATAAGANSTALGQGATANNANAVALGSGSTTAAAVATTGDTINGTAYTYAGTAPTSTVSVGSAGNERTVTNVAAGRVSASSTDAVNGSQLYATDQAVDSLAGVVTASKTHYYSVNDGGTQGGNYNNDGATGTNALAAGVGATASGVSSFAGGNGAAAQADNALALGALSSASVAGGVAIGSGSVSNRAVLSGIGSIANGTHAIPFNTSDQTLLGAVSFGSAAGNTYRQLTNVADGTQAQDAVTIRQLAGALSSFAVSGQMYFHANSTAADSLAVGAQSIAVGPTTVVNGDNGVGIGNGAIVDSTAPGGVAIGESSNAAQADAIALGSGSIASGAQSIAQGANAKAANAGGIAIGSGAQSSAIDAVAMGSGASASMANSVALGAGSVTTVGALSNYIAYGLSSPQSSAGEVNIGNRQITGVAAGKAGTDAVNVSQLAAVTTQLTTLINNQNGGGGAPFASTPGSSPASTGSNSSAGGQGSVASGSNSTAVGNSSQASATGATAVGVGAAASGNNSVALGAGSTDGGRSNVVSVGSLNDTRQVANVAAGTQGTDAVNVNQLNAGLAQANAYTDQRVDQLQSGINSVARNAYSGIAATTALTMIPEVDKDKTLSFGIGTGGFRGYQAVALGGTARITENIKMKAGVGMSPGGTTFGMGAAMQW
ncbi:YadA family autotransporter adhesin, partial [Paraburkholderia dipogonis]